VRLMRNFGQHNALACGFAHARGEVIVTIDDDLQQDPESIHRLLESLEREGFDVVYGTYRDKQHERVRNLGSRLLAWMHRRVFRSDVTPTSFRAIRRDVVREIVRYDRSFTYIDGLIAWHTQRIGEVEVPHHPRADGRSGYTLAKLATHAMNILTNFTAFPLRVVSCVGLGASLVGLVLGAWYLIAALRGAITVPGYASTIVAILVLGGCQLMALGVLGEYVGRLHLSMSRKPQYAVRERIGGESRTPQPNRATDSGRCG
jgi:glycosyltransferase involved in cell wall biosynthesis